MRVLEGRFKTTLNYWMMMERYQDLKEEVGGSIPDCEISSLLDIKLARWSIASYALALACRPSVKRTWTGSTFSTNESA
jgi:hypothetical protein